MRSLISTILFAALLAVGCGRSGSSAATDTVGGQQIVKDVSSNNGVVLTRTAIASGPDSASDYASQLNIHVNHLNRAVKETTEKTTSQLIAERFIQEAKILLKHSNWNVSEIAWALGFTEVSHFNNFFKKHARLSPLKFRNV